MQGWLDGPFKSLYKRSRMLAVDQIELNADERFKFPGFYAAVSLGSRCDSIRRSRVMRL
jgi:hypothetical protein